ncbi:MAG: hypothetical protein P1S60_02165 [Anaerolineae bacterium]|nr:hypothetical protein [Anaerolineae bacterium]
MMWKKPAHDVTHNVSEYQEEPLGKRIGRFVTLLGLLFAVSAGVVVTQRLSEDALALLLGLVCGVAAMVPTIALGVVWMRREMAYHGPSQQLENKMQQQPLGQPQVIVVAPQALPGTYPFGYSGQPVISSPESAPWQPVPAQREFKIVGGID